MAAVPLDGRTVVIVEQWPMLRIGVARVCQSAGMRVVDSSDDVYRGLAAVRREGAGVLILGRIGSAVAPLVRLVRQAKDAPQPPAVVVLTLRARSEAVSDLLAAGADALLVESSSPDDLLAALGQVFGGERVVAPSLIPALAGLRPCEQRAGSDGLTDRQREILARLADGLSNAQIGAALYISPHTVRTHLAQIYERLGVGNRRDALARAISLGVLG